MHNNNNNNNNINNSSGDSSATAARVLVPPAAALSAAELSRLAPPPPPPRAVIVRAVVQELLSQAAADRLGSLPTVAAALDNDKKSTAASVIAAVHSKSASVNASASASVHGGGSAVVAVSPATHGATSAHGVVRNPLVVALVLSFLPLRALCGAARVSRAFALGSALARAHNAVLLPLALAGFGRRDPGSGARGRRNKCRCASRVWAHDEDNSDSDHCDDDDDDDDGVRHLDGSRGGYWAESIDGPGPAGSGSGGSGSKASRNSLGASKVEVARDINGNVIHSESENDHDGNDNENDDVAKDSDNAADPEAAHSLAVIDAAPAAVAVVCHCSCRGCKLGGCAGPSNSSMSHSASAPASCSDCSDDGHGHGDFYTDSDGDGDGDNNDDDAAANNSNNNNNNAGSNSNAAAVSRGGIGSRKARRLARAARRAAAAAAAQARAAAAARAEALEEDRAYGSGPLGDEGSVDPHTLRPTVPGANCAAGRQAARSATAAAAVSSAQRRQQRRQRQRKRVVPTVRGRAWALALGVDGSVTGILAALGLDADYAISGETGRTDSDGASCRSPVLPPLPSQQPQPTPHERVLSACYVALCRAPLPASTALLIAKDVPRTLLHLSAFPPPPLPPAAAFPSPSAHARAVAAAAQAAEAAANAALARVLHCAALLDPAVTYCQGMNFLAGQLLTQLPEPAALWAMYALLSGTRAADAAADADARVVCPLGAAAEAENEAEADAAVVRAPGTGLRLKDTLCFALYTGSNSLYANANRRMSSGGGGKTTAATVPDFAGRVFPRAGLSAARAAAAAAGSAPDLSFRALFLPSLAGMRVWRFVFNELLREQRPALFAHLVAVSLPIDVLTEVRDAPLKLTLLMLSYVFFSISHCLTRFLF